MTDAATLSDGGIPAEADGAAARGRMNRQTALEAAVRTQRPGLDTADHVVQAARKYFAFLEGRDQ